jgi:hypothetical protein
MIQVIFNGGRSEEMNLSFCKACNPLKDKGKLLHNNPMQFTIPHTLSQQSSHLMII